MLFQPAIVALLLASAICLVTLAVAAPFAVQLIRGWDLRSGSERQLRLERRTYLFSTLLALILAVQLAGLLLFVFNADRLSLMFVGAMCAVGTLNANAYGFPALIVQIAAFFLAAMWLAVNHVDNLAPDYPLVRVKYRLLLSLTPLLAVAAWLQLKFFLGLEADVITSCCGSLFSDSGDTLAGELSALPPRPAMWLFYGTLATAITAGMRQRQRGRGAWLTAAAGLAAFVAGIVGILSFVSLYVYEHPHHHCPFCLLKAEYGYQGYALYLPLFVATAAALSAGAIRPFAGHPSLADVVPMIGRRLAGIAAGGFMLFAAVATIMVLSSNLVLLE